MKSISKINGIYLYDLIRDYDNCLKAVKEACKDHKHNPVVLNIKENAEEYPLEDGELQEITEILIDAYNNVRVYDKDNQSLESAMDLLDALLEKEDVNYYLNRCLQTLEE